jgi:4-hydroxybenzoate polyprenyltransferase
MTLGSRWVSGFCFAAGFLIILSGMIAEFAGSIVLPSDLMRGAYESGGFLALFILFFAAGMHLLRRGIFGWWRARLDSVVYGVAAILCAAAALETVLGLQAGHPYTYLAETNPLLMILLWLFVLPPTSPWTCAVLAIALGILAIMNWAMPPRILRPQQRVTDSVKPASARSWRALGRLTRINVWLGDILLFVFAFVLLAAPPLSAPPLPLYSPVTWLRFALAISSIGLFISFIFIQNQLGDLDTDRLHPDKSRLPVAAGQLTPRSAMGLAVLFLVLSVGLALMISTIFLAILAFTVVLGFLYSGPPLRLKGKPVVDVAVIGLAFGALAVLTAWVVLSLRPQVPLLLPIGAWLFYSGAHAVHTASDHAADRQAGLRTTAVVLGPRRAVQLGLVLISIGFVLLYSAVGYFTHLFWYGLLKFKSIFLFTFGGLPFLSVLEAHRRAARLPAGDTPQVEQLHRQGRSAAYCLFLILIVYCLLYIFLYYPTYYPSYQFPW